MLSQNVKISDGGRSQIHPLYPSMYGNDSFASAKVLDSIFPDRFADVRNSGYCIQLQIFAGTHISATRKDILLYISGSRNSGRFHVDFFFNTTLQECG